MGTTCEIAAPTANGRWKRIHISYDGYVQGVGLVLFRDYATPEKVAALFSHRTGATQLCTDPDEMHWTDWHPEEGITLEELIAEHTMDLSAFPDEQAFRDEHGDTPGYLGVYVHAHGKWAAPHDVETMRAFIETGECADVLTRELLIAQDVDEERFDGRTQKARSIDIHRGVIHVERITEDGEEGYRMSLTEEREPLPEETPEQRQAYIDAAIARHPDADPAELAAMFDAMDADDDEDDVILLAPTPDFEGIAGAEEQPEDSLDWLDGRTVEVRAGSFMVSSSFGPDGSESSSVMTVRRITVLPEQAAG